MPQRNQGTKEIAGGEKGKRNRKNRQKVDIRRADIYLSHEGKKDKRSQQGTQEAKILSRKDQQTFSPSVEKFHSVFQVHGEGRGV